MTSRRFLLDPLWLAVAFAAAGVLIVAVSAEWLDFRALRVPVLLAVGLCALATAFFVVPRTAPVAEFARTSVVGAAIWGAGGALYAVIHASRGEAFDASRFGAQWSQALGLIGVHALFLGVPTGVAAALALLVVRRWLPVRARAAPAGESA